MNKNPLANQTLGNSKKTCLLIGHIYFNQSNTRKFWLPMKKRVLGHAFSLATKISECLIGLQIPLNEIMSDRNKSRDGKNFLKSVRCFKCNSCSFDLNIFSRIQIMIKKDALRQEVLERKRSTEIALLLSFAANLRRRFLFTRTQKCVLCVKNLITLFVGPREDSRCIQRSILNQENLKSLCIFVILAFCKRRTSSWCTKIIAKNMRLELFQKIKIFLISAFVMSKDRLK